VVLNPAAGGATDAASVEAAVRGASDWDLIETTDAGHGRELAAGSLAAGYERVVAAGGDGTIHEVVQGLALHPGRARLGVIPLGTGNDLARTLAIPDDPHAAVTLVMHGRERSIDLVRVDGGDGPRWCINMAAGGFSGEVDMTVDDRDLKERWGPLAYVVGAVETAREIKPYEVSVQLDHEPAEIVRALAVLVANGRTCAGGVRVAPLADPEDGLLDIVIIRHGTILELTGLAARVASGTILESPHVLHRRGRRARIESVPPMWFNVDGELLTQEPLVFTVEPRRIRVVVGPEYHRDPIFD
jgi:diacylglycerol kinase (ATP)